MAETVSCCTSVPALREQRDELRRLAREVVRRKQLVPPLTLDELHDLANQLSHLAGCGPAIHDYLMVLVNNALWEGTVAAIPFERRVLILPQCLRDRSTCPAELDEFGLLCEQCGQCPTGELLGEAEELGYVVLVAEGTTVVTSLLETGQVDCVIGVSCLSTLERSFPFTTAAAIPALALPLISDGCDATNADFDWVREAIGLRSAEFWQANVDLNGLRSEVDSWFAAEAIEELLSDHATKTEKLAAEWTASGGKRWRPFLATCVQRALGGRNGESMRRLAVAVECFHKASLVHDDIEDDEVERYDMPAMHRRHGVPIALNVGDLLVGEGYRLIAESGLEPEEQARMLRVAALSHRELCLGQGEELCWTHDPGPLTVDTVLEIFRRKTAPAFEVALVLGAICGGADDEVCAVLADMSRALGIAYQIRDDLEDFDSEDLAAMRPSVLVAMALEQADVPTQKSLETELESGRWNGGATTVKRLVETNGLKNRAWRLYDEYRKEALAALRPLTHQPLKSLLFRIIHKVLAEPPEISEDAAPLSNRSDVTSLPIVNLPGESSEDATV